MVDFLRKVTKSKNPEKSKIKIVQDIIPRGAVIPEVRASYGVGERKIKVGVLPDRDTKDGAGLGPPKKAESGREVQEVTVRAWEPFIRTRVNFNILFASRKVWVGAVVAFFLICGIIFSIVFASTVITVRPVTAQVSIAPLTVTANSNINVLDVVGREIPALKIVTENAYKVSRSASGKKYLEEPARGTIKIFNVFDSSPQTLVRTTRFVDPDGKIFRLVNTTTVPGAKVQEGKIIPSSVEAEVVADRAGEEYNIQPARFTIPGFKGTPKFGGFYGESSSPMKNGFRGEARVVTAEDIKNGQEEVTRELFAKLRSELDGKIPSGDEFVVLDGARNILVTDLASPKAGARKDEFTIDGRGRAEVVMFKKSDLFSLLGSVLLSSERPSIILENPDGVTLKNVRLNAAKGELTFTVEGSATAVRSVQIQEMQSGLAGKTIARAEAYLRGRPEITGFAIKIFPFWRWRIPNKIEKIEVKVELPNNQ